MPRLSYFFGIAIYMYFNDHQPPHFHACYAEYEAQITIETLEVTQGRIPRRALALVLEWASLHRDELDHNWELARQRLPLDPIAPLR